MASIALYCFLYGGAAVFLLGCLVRILQYATDSVHLRWELYPVREGNPSRFNILYEIIFLKSLHDANRTLWLRSFPFHIGLYLLTLSAVVVIAVATSGGESFRPAARLLYRTTGIGGLLLSLAGALGLLSRRIMDRELRAVTTSGDLFNLSFFAITLTLLLSAALSPVPGSGPVEILRRAMNFDTSVRPPAMLAAGLMLGSMLLAYIPMTHMAHCITRCFTCHNLQINDEPDTGDPFDQRMAAYLGYRPAHGGTS